MTRQITITFTQCTALIKFLSPQTALESGEAPPKPSGFSFKGFSSMIFGAETSDALEAKIEVLDEQIKESEDSVQAMEDDLGYVGFRDGELTVIALENFRLGFSWFVDTFSVDKLLLPPHFRAFVKESLKDYERFKKQEVRDIKAILSSHIKTQIKLCKLVS